MEINKAYNENCLDTMKCMPDGFVDLLVSSPPYNIGKEYENNKLSIDGYVQSLLPWIRKAHRILKSTGSLCFQVGNYVKDGRVYPLDCMLFNHFIYAGFIPRNRIIWHFGHGLHCKNRFSGRHETILWFTRSDNYTFNLDPVRVPSKFPNKKYFKGDKKGELSCNPLGKNPSDVWEISNVKHNHPEKTAHPCQFPEFLSDRLVLSLTNENDLVLDPFCGAGTSCVSASKYNRNYIGIDKEAAYVKIAESRLSQLKFKLAS